MNDGLKTGRPAMTNEGQSLIALYIRYAPTIRPEDSIGRAAELLRNGAAPAVPVLNGTDPIGLVTERELGAALNGHTPDQGLDAPVSCLMSRGFTTVTLNDTRDEARRRLGNANHSLLVVTDTSGHYVGLVSASDLMSRPATPQRPRMIGGMATPLGVFLTTGAVSAGAAGLGLTLTGALLMLLFILSDLTVYLIAWAFERYTGVPLLAWARSPYLGVGTVSDFVGPLVQASIIPVFLFYMRMLPLAGTHAAEHQVVHAIERGERLSLEVVRRMPRVHPRCGTNLAAGSMLFLGLAQFNEARGLGELGLLLALVLTIFFWRPVGNFIQRVATTKPATDQQLSGAIEVGKRLLELHHRSGVDYVSFSARLARSGLAQVFVGWALALGAVAMAQQFGFYLPVIGQ